MNKTAKHFLIDTILIGLLLASGASGILLWAGVVPRGSALRLFFKFMHKWGGLGLALLATYHLMLHWDLYTKTWQNIMQKQTKDVSRTKEIQQ